MCLCIASASNRLSPSDTYAAESIKQKLIKQELNLVRCVYRLDIALSKASICLRDNSEQEVFIRLYMLPSYSRDTECILLRH